VAFAALATLVSGCSRPAFESPTRGALVVAAAESHAPLAAREAALFTSLYSGAGVRVQKTTTREAYVALLEDSVRLVVADRPPNAEEQQAIDKLRLEVQQVRIAEDGLGIVVNAANGIESLSIEQISALLGGRVTDWRQVPGADLSGAVNVVTTGRNSGAWELLSGTFFASHGPICPGIVAASQRDVLARIAADPRALGVVSVAAWKQPADPVVPGTAAAAAGAPNTTATAGWAPGVRTSNLSDKVRALAIASVDSLGQPVRHALHQANIHLGVYPLHYPVYVVFNTKSRLAAGFSAFIASAPGQKLILDSGLVPATMPVRIVQLH
jgi:phosphate transport system substrate-binding protein